MLTKSKSILQTGNARWAIVRKNSRDMAEKWQQADLASLAAPELLGGVRELFKAAAEYYTVAQSGPIPVAQSSEISFGRFYRSLIKRKGDPEVTAFLLGFETLALRAEKSLYDLACWIQAKPALADYFRNASTETICASLRNDSSSSPRL